MGIIQKLTSQNNVPKIDSMWRHYKGNVYKVIGHGICVDKIELLIIYKRSDVENADTWVRSLSNWMQTVETGEARFLEITNE